MLEDKKINFRTNCAFEKLNKVLNSNGFVLINDYFESYIYMTNLNICFNKVKSLKEINSYAVIENYNNEEKRIVLREYGKLQGNIKGVNSTKELLTKLGFKEFMNLDAKFYTYKKDNYCIDLILVQGLYTYICFSDDKKQYSKKVIYDIFESSKIGVEYKENIDVEQDMFEKKRINFK